VPKELKVLLDLKGHKEVEDLKGHKGHKMMP
jgi:hypothetical protein